MEIALHPALPSQVLLAPHQGGERLLVAVVKATFAWDDPTATPLPADQQVPLFATDQAFAGTDEPFRAEHDLAAFKPRTDAVVLGPPAPPDPNPRDGRWRETVRRGAEAMTGGFLNGQLETLNGAIPNPAPNWPASQVTFGWQRRSVAPRKDLAGTFPESPPDPPLPPGRLPGDFQDGFFNGGLYVGGTPVFTHPPTGASWTLETAAEYPLPPPPIGAFETRTRTRTLHFPARPPRALLCYRDGPFPSSPIVEEELAMRLDTLVIDKTTGRFSAVWRGVWPYDRVPAECYLRLGMG